MDEIVNKVANSGIVTIDPEALMPPEERVIFDIRPHLFQELILKEKDFRAFIREHDFSQYSGKIVGLVCTAEAIVPTWAYMLLTMALQPFARSVHFADARQLEEALLLEEIARMDLEKYRDARIVIKGCGDKPVPVNLYVQLSRALMPYAKSIMYGEPCSTVPLYKSGVKQAKA